MLDELPYRVDQDAGFAADLQKAWDRTLERSPVLIIGLARERAPLHGRPTLELHVAPLDPRAVGEITGAADAADAFDRYLVVGSFPLLARHGRRVRTRRRSWARRWWTTRRRSPPRPCGSSPPSSSATCRQSA